MTAVKRLFGEGFRVFFLAAGLFALAAVALWLAVVLGLWDLPLSSAWHAHEMVFGYGAAALGGFFLTAAPNWTGTKTAPHGFIALVSGLWLLGRVAVLAAGVLPPEPERRCHARHPGRRERHADRQLAAAHLVEQLSDTVKADRRSVERCKIEVSHHISSLIERHVGRLPATFPRHVCWRLS